MQKIMNAGTEDGHRRRGPGHHLMKCAAAILATALALTWFWSTVAMDVFQAPPVRFVDALAAVLVFLSLAYGCGAAFRLGRDHDAA